MKKIICLLILLSYQLICLGQSELESGDVFGQEMIPDPNHPQTDSVKGPDVPHVRQTWKWMRQGVYRRQIPLDTNLDGVHNYNYIFKKSIANTYLGNLPSPYEADIFINRNRTEDFYPLTYIRAFVFKSEDALSFNTTTPYTRLKYFTGGGRGKAENLLDVWHVQNIKPWWSAGIRYNLISSDGRYARQKSKAYNFSLFSTYEKDRTNLSLFLNQNNGHIQENGGIKDRAYVTDSTSQKAENMPVWLNGSDAQNDYRNLNLNLQAQYFVGKAKPVANGRDTTFSYPAKAVVNLRMEDNEHKYHEASVNHEFYPVSYQDSTFTYNKEKHRVYEALARLVLNEHPKHKYLPGLHAGLRHLREEYRQLNSIDSTSDTALMGKDVYSSTYLTGGIFNVDSASSLQYDVALDLGIMGEHAGNFKVDGYITQYLNKKRNSYVQANALFELKDPNHFLNMHIGNHDMWRNDFKAIKTIHADGRYVNGKLRLEAGIGFTNLFSLVHFDTLATPQQTDKTLVVLTAWAKETFRLGHFYFNQNLYFQQSSEEDILSLPSLTLYSHNYYRNWLFKNALDLQIGVDVYYNTEFYADNYRPSIMQFYAQRKFKTGNYPKVDIFLNLHIKRANVFAKYEHLNQVIKKNGNYFSAADYPINPGMFKFGIRWDFHD